MGTAIFKPSHQVSSSGDQMWHRRGVVKETSSKQASSTPGTVNLWMDVALNRCLLTSKPWDRAWRQCAVMVASRRPPVRCRSVARSIVEYWDCACPTIACNVVRTFTFKADRSTASL